MPGVRPACVTRRPATRMPGVWPASDQKKTKYTPRTTSQLAAAALRKPQDGGADEEGDPREDQVDDECGRARGDARKGRRCGDDESADQAVEPGEPPANKLGELVGECHGRLSERSPKLGARQHALERDLEGVRADDALDEDDDC